MKSPLLISEQQTAKVRKIYDDLTGEPSQKYTITMTAAQAENVFKAIGVTPQNVIHDRVGPNVSRAPFFLIPFGPDCLEIEVDAPPKPDVQPILTGMIDASPSSKVLWSNGRKTTVSLHGLLLVHNHRLYLTNGDNFLDLVSFGFPGLKVGWKHQTEPRNTYPYRALEVQTKDVDLAREAANQDIAQARAENGLYWAMRDPRDSRIYEQYRLVTTGDIYKQVLDRQRRFGLRAYVSTKGGAPRVQYGKAEMFRSSLIIEREQLTETGQRERGFQSIYPSNWSPEEIKKDLLGSGIELTEQEWRAMTVVQLLLHQHPQGNVRVKDDRVRFILPFKDALLLSNTPSNSGSAGRKMIEGFLGLNKSQKFRYKYREKGKDVPVRKEAPLVKVSAYDSLRAAEREEGEVSTIPEGYKPHHKEWFLVLEPDPIFVQNIRLMYVARPTSILESLDNYWAGKRRPSFTHKVLAFICSARYDQGTYSTSIKTEVFARKAGLEKEWRNSPSRCIEKINALLGDLVCNGWLYVAYCEATKDGFTHLAPDPYMIQNGDAKRLPLTAPELPGL